MNEIIDVPMKGQRDLATVTAEIRSYCTAAQTMMVTYAIEIGRRLVEAKSMVKHGEWGDYLREELGLSQSTANNHMKLFEGYAAGQISLTGAALKNQAFANLTYTKALALLALPSEEEREAFVEAHDVGSMSTRELREELRKRGEAQDETPPHPSPAATPSPQGEGFGTGDAEGLRKALEAMKGLRKQDAEHIKEIEAQAYQAHQARDEALKAQDAAQKASSEAEKKAQAAAAELAKSKAELEKAKKAEADALEKLKTAKANPTVPKETLEKLRQEAEEAAEKRHKADYEDLDQARAKLTKAEAEAAKARQEAERLEKELKLASPGVAVFRDQFARLQRDLGILINSIDELPEDKQAGARKGLHTILRNYLDMLEEPEEGAQG